MLSMAAFRPGQRLDGYEILDVLGQGGMGTVYRALQVSMRRHVALKVLSPELAERDPSFCERFVAEARAAGRLNHPNIIAVHDVGQTVIDEHQVFYYVMELIEGQDCKLLLRQHGRLDTDQVASIAQGIAAALVYAEAVGIVHRDIKPENIMLTNDGMIKLADLGLALQLDQVEAVESPGDRRVMGTPRYMSPEQARGRPVDHRSDQYCLGAALFHLLTGQPPYQATTSKELMRAHVLSAVPDPRTVFPGISEPWRRLLMSMLSKRPEERYPSAEALLNAIRSVNDGRIPTQPPAPGITLPPRRQNQAIIIAGVVIGLIVLMVLVRSMASDDSESSMTVDDSEDTTPAMPSSSEARRLRAERLVAELPDDLEQAVKELRQQVRNPYFKGHEAAEMVLEEAYKQRRQALWQRREARRKQAMAVLQDIQQQVQAGQLQQAATALAAQAQELQEQVPEAYQQTQEALAQAVDSAARSTIATINQAETADVITQALRSYRESLAPEQLDQRVMKLAAARQEALEAARLEAEKAAREARLQQEQETWQQMRQLLLASRGESGIAQPVPALEEAAAVTEDAERQARYERLAGIYAAVADIESAVRDHVHHTPPLISISGMDREAILLDIYGDRVEVRTLYPHGILEVARDSVDVDWGDLAYEALPADAEHLIADIPHWLWYWHLGGEAPPDLVDQQQAEEDDAPAAEDPSMDEQARDPTDELTLAAPPAASDFTLDLGWPGSGADSVQPPWRATQEPVQALIEAPPTFLAINGFSLNREQALASFQHFDGQLNNRIAQPIMQLHDVGLRWSCAAPMTRSSILERQIPLSVLQHGIAQRISVDCQLGPSSLILIGLAQRGHRIRIGFDSR
ncbi:MAG: protein kinase domain-containing protein, partial [Planctomycetota bacterium]